jgi:hypothetical protein
MKTKLTASIGTLAFLASSATLAAPQDKQVVPPPQQPGTSDHQEPLFMRSEVVPHDGRGVVESMEDVLRREANFEPRSQVNHRMRNGRQGSWRVPGIRRTYRTHSGRHHVFNKWGDTRMGIGFNRLVDLEGAWVAGHGPVGGEFAKGLQVIGYRDGREVARTDVHQEVGIDYTWFAMDLAGVDRVEFIAGASHMGAGWFAMDDLSFVDVGTGERTLLDFEDLAYEDVLTGAGYLGLTWEEGTGVFDDAMNEVFQGPAGSGAGAPPPGGGVGAGSNGGGTYSGQGTLPVLIQNFKGPRSTDAGAGWVPPDTCGAVGIDYFVSVVNMHISIYQKSTGVRVFSSSLQSFFNTGQSAGDPRVAFDPDSERWIVNATDFNDDIWLAVSSTSDPTGSWFKTSFNPGQGSDSGDWPDYQTLGVDNRWIMTAAYMVGGSATMSLFCIDKAPLVASSQSMGQISAFRQLNWEGAIHPCVHWEDPGVAYAVSYNSSSRLRIRTVSPPVNSPTLTSKLVNLSQSWSSPPSAPVQGSNNLDTLDGRLMNAVYQAGSVWTTHAVSNGGRASSRFYELDPVSGTQLQLGTVRDNVNQSLYFFNPSISVNSAGHAVLGCTGSDANTFATAYYTGRLVSDPPGEMAFPVAYKTGAGAYSAGGGTQRWGDYSLTSTDPVDGTVWTIQEHATNNPGTWGNNIAQLGFAEDCSSNIARYCDPSVLGTQIDVDTCSLGAGSINMTYSGGSPGMVGYLLVGSGNGIVNNPPGATGNLCLSGANIGRYIADAAVIDAAGTIVTDVINGNTGGGSGNLPLAVGGGSLQPGDSWNWQYWARHAGFSSTFSDAMTVTFTN